MYKNHAFTLTGQINWQDTKTYCNEVQKKTFCIQVLDLLGKTPLFNN